MRETTENIINKNVSTLSSERKSVINFDSFLYQPTL